MTYAIIGYSAKKISPYLQFYISYLSAQGVKFDYYTREISENCLDDKLDNNQYRITCTGKSKVLNLVKWKRSIIKALDQRNYDRLIILTVYPAIILKEYLCKNYHKQFILDIRDYAKILKSRYIFKRLKAVQKSCAFTVVSSDGFRNWLPIKNDTYTLHNCPIGVTSIDFKQTTLKNHRDNPTLGYFGVMAYIEQNIAIINDSNRHGFLSLYYAGVYDDKSTLQNYVFENGYKNVQFDGPFENSYKKELYKKVDLINAIYGSSSMIVTSALPNKLYDAIIYGKPIIVSKGTFLCEVVEKYKLGIGVDYQQHPIGEIRKYVELFDENVFIKGCNKYLSYCIEDNSKTMNIIDRFVKNEK